MVEPQVTFGRRGAAPARRGGAPALRPGSEPARTESGIPVEELALRLGLRPGSGFEVTPGEAEPAARDGRVPWSLGASLIAGLATSCILTAATVFQARNGSPGAAATLLGLSRQQMLLGAILGSLFSAGTAGGIALPLAHFALKRLGATQIPAYALACGALAAGLSFLPLVGGSDNLAMATAGGVLTGFFYRLFAGRR